MVQHHMDTVRVLPFSQRSHHTRVHLEDDNDINNDNNINIYNNKSIVIIIIIEWCSTTRILYEFCHLASAATARVST